MTESSSAALRLRLDLSYNGSGYAGWAVQPGLRTVAGVLGDALALLFREPVRLGVAGRTDAGVHAAGQVAHVDVNADRLAGLAARSGPGSAAEVDTPGLIGLRRRLAGILPTDLRVRQISVAAEGFDARFAALRRHYRYRIGTADWGVDPLRGVGVLGRPRPLDVPRMHRAAQTLLGLHDFAAYCRPREGSTTIRDLQRLDVHADGDEVVVDVTADAFCHSMVRSLVGVLLGVGDGRLDIGAPAVVLAAGRRTATVHTAAASGLTLIRVDYPPDADLPARTELTRAIRDLEGRTEHLRPND